MPEYQDEYKSYLAACKGSPISYEDFAAECEAEDADEARQYEEHIRRMTCCRRYI